MFLMWGWWKWLGGWCASLFVGCLSFLVCCLFIREIVLSVCVSCLAAAAWLHDGRMWAWLLCCLVGGHVAVGCFGWAV